MTTNKTATILIRTEPDTKKAADAILARLGLTTSSAVNMFLHQVIEEESLPFRSRIVRKPDIPDFDTMTDEEISRMLDEASKEVDEGKTRPFEEVVGELEAKYGIRV